MSNTEDGQSSLKKSNVYLLRRSQVQHSQARRIQAPVKKGLKFGQVIKAGSLNSPADPSADVQSYFPSKVPLGLSEKRVPRPDIISATVQSNLALNSLKQNFQTLNDLQARLRFMLQELEEFIKE